MKQSRARKGSNVADGGCKPAIIERRKKMRITDIRLDMIESALNRMEYEQFDDMVKVSTTSGLFDEKLTWGVNWGCCGTRNAAEALEMAEALTKGANIANALNNLELEHYWNSEDMNVSREEYLDQKELVYRLIVSERYGLLERWIKEGNIA